MKDEELKAYGIYLSDPKPGEGVLNTPEKLKIFLEYLKNNSEEEFKSYNIAKWKSWISSFKKVLP